MKIIVSILIGLFIVFAVFFFGAYGLIKLFKWAGWSNDMLALTGIIFMLLAGLFLAAWQMSKIEF